MALYKVTIHEHKIYDSFIEAISEADAEELAENQIFEEDSHGWREDYNAGWSEIGEITMADEEDLDD
jgi:hypothetical protein